MAEKVKVVNGHVIKVMTRDEVDKELKAKGDWGVSYFVPGRKLYPYFITVNRIRHRFDSLEDAEKLCKAYKKETLKSMSVSEIEDVLRVI